MAFTKREDFGPSGLPENLMHPNDLKEIMDSLRGEELTIEELLHTLLDGGVELDYLTTRYRTSVGYKNLLMVIACQDNLTVDFDDLLGRFNRTATLAARLPERLEKEFFEAKEFLKTDYVDSPLMSLEWAFKRTQSKSIVAECERLHHLLSEVLREKGKWKAPTTVAEVLSTPERITIRVGNSGVTLKKEESPLEESVVKTTAPREITPLEQSRAVKHILKEKDQEKIAELRGLAYELKYSTDIKSRFKVSWGKGMWKIIPPDTTTWTTPT